MTTTRHLLSSGSFTQDWTDAGLITTNDDWSGVPSIMGFRGDNIITTDGIDPTTVTNGTPAVSAVLDVNANQTNPITFNTGGVTEFGGTNVGDNPTIAIAGSATADAPHIVIFLDATGRENVRFRANLRDLDGSADNAAQQVAVQWRVGGGNWNNAAHVADATLGGSATLVTAVDVTLPSGANNAADLEIRVITTNAVGNDEPVGIDDIIVSSTGAGPDVTAPTLAAVNPADPDDGAIAVAGDSNIVLRFTENIVAGTGSITLSNGTDIRTIAIGDGQVTISGNTLTINPTTDLVGGTTYAVTAGAGIVEDSAGNDFAGIAAGALDFTVAAPLVPITIGAIQGLGHTSLYAGSIVRTQGVVTAIDTNGFYIQSAVGAGDGDARTSDGIFVFTSVGPAGIAKGDLVQVDGTVSEFLPGGDSRNLTITQIITPTYSKLATAAFETVIIGNGFLLPPTSVIDDDAFASYQPASDGIDFWESLEGMLITIDAPIAVSNTSTDFGETDVVASGGVGATGMSASGGIAISQGDYNPEKLQLDNDNGLFAGFTNVFSVGDRLSNVTGVISYSFQNFELLVTAAVTTTTDVTAVKEVTALTEAADRVSIADYNLENLSAVDSPVKIASLAADIVNNLKSPDIIGVQEIQDANGAASGGSLSGQPTADALIAAIVLAGGPAYAYVEVAPAVANSTGGEPGGNIRNGFFYDPARVSYVAGSVALIEDAAFNGSRRPVVAEFVFNGETITIINVHSTSRGGSDPLWGSTQPPADNGDAARTAQATAVRAYVNTLLASDPDARIIVQGDFNGFTWENAITALTTGGVLSDLATLLPPGERYSYQFGGNNQQLDHMLATPNLRAVAQFDAVHLNAELLEAQQISTDHDALLAVFEIPVQVTGTENPERIDGSSADEVIRALGGNDSVYGNGGDDAIFGGNGADTLKGGTGVNRIFGGDGNDVIGGGARSGVQIVDGGAGSDYFVVNSDTETVVVNLAAGTVSGGYSNGSTLTSIEMLKTVNGNFAVEFYGDNKVNNLIGTKFADILSGGGGNDKLTGGKGPDTLTGGAGNDKFAFARGDVTGDTITDFAGNGAGVGDTLIFTGFGPGASLSNIGNIWTISYGAGLTEVFTMNATSLAPGDVIFG